MRQFVVALIASVVAALGHAGVAQAQAESAPTTVIVYADKGPSGMTDIPMGAHRIPDSNVIISGHQKGGMAGPLFGVFGMLAQSAVNADIGRGAVGSAQDKLRFDVAAKVTDVAGAIVTSERYRHRFTLSPSTSGRTLSIVPYVVITFVSEAEVRPYVVLKTTLSPQGAGGASSKTTKYFCCEGKPFPLSGVGGITENNGALLKDIITSEMETAINVMLLDSAQTYSRENLTKVSIRGYLPFAPMTLKVKGYEIGRYNDYSLFEIPGGNVFAGVQISEQSSLEVVTANSR